MRRGLLGWSADEVPMTVFDARLEAVRHTMAAEAVQALIVYTDFARPAAVFELTHFIPYWARGVLVVTHEQSPALITALSHRVADWIRDSSTLQTVVCTPDIGGGIAASLPAAATKVAVLNLSQFPGDALGSLRAARPQLDIVDGTALYERGTAAMKLAGVGQFARAAQIAAAALQAGLDVAAQRDANLFLAEAERIARRLGAEECLFAIAPNCAADARLRRVEGVAALGDVFAVQISVAYKGCWIRQGFTASTTGPLAWLVGLNAWFDQITAADGWEACSREQVVDRIAGAQQGTLVEWRLEGTHADRPLALLCGSQWPDLDRAARPAGGRTLSLRLSTPQGPWFAARPLSLEEVH
jgi:hypothetical protein